VREIAGAALQIGKNPVAAFRPQTGNLIGEKTLIIHHSLRIKFVFTLQVPATQSLI
jgi:hypothetical protein